MAEEFGDEQIRIELKRLVEDLRAKTVREWDKAESEAALTPGATATQIQDLSQKIEESKGMMSLRLQQMIDFIDRR